jgi:hypothetical protein
MLELSKNILEKVSFDRFLFRKELFKAINWINPNEKNLLKAWCLAKFENEFKNEILEVFNNLPIEGVSLPVFNNRITDKNYRKTIQPF